MQLDRYTAAILRYRWLVIALATLVMLAITAGVRFITVTNDYRIMFGEDNPQLAAFDALENTYSVTNGGTDCCYAARWLGIQPRGTWRG